MWWCFILKNYHLEGIGSGIDMKDYRWLVWCISKKGVFGFFVHDLGELTVRKRVRQGIRTLREGEDWMDY